MTRFDVQVLGAGIVGKSLALSLARLGLQVALRAEPATGVGIHAPALASASAGAGASAGASAGEDVRAYALNAASVALLSGLKVWQGLPAGSATPVLEMAVKGDADRGAIDFTAWQQRVDALAWITDAGVLERELAAAVRFSPHVTVLDDGPAGDDEVADVPLTALCEGRASATRDRLGVGFERHDYRHRAIAARLTSSARHRGIARQWFRSPDVLALLPFDAPEPGRSFALVWSLPDEQAQALLSADIQTFEARLMEATGGDAGELRLGSVRAAWPLMQARASAWCGPGWALLGDAAHVVHPLAGQGLNLGLADVATLAAVIGAREPWRPLGDEKLLRRYARQRAGPTWAMGQVTDGLLQLFSHEASALRELRNRGLGLVNQLTPVKRWLAGQALAPVTAESGRPDGRHLT